MMCFSSKGKKKSCLVSFELGKGRLVDSYNMIHLYNIDIIFKWEAQDTFDKELGLLLKVSS